MLEPFSLEVREQAFARGIKVMEMPCQIHLSYGIGVKLGKRSKERKPFFALLLCHLTTARRYLRVPCMLSIDGGPRGLLFLLSLVAMHIPPPRQLKMASGQLSISSETKYRNDLGVHGTCHTMNCNRVFPAVSIKMSCLTRHRPAQWDGGSVFFFILFYPEIANTLNSQKKFHRNKVGINLDSY